MTFEELPLNQPIHLAAYSDFRLDDMVIHVERTVALYTMKDVYTLAMKIAHGMEPGWVTGFDGFIEEYEKLTKGRSKWLRWSDA